MAAPPNRANLIDVSDLQDFLQRERQAAAAETALKLLLTDEALVDRGDAITGLKVRSSKPGLLVLDCESNESRFRPGSKIELHCNAAHIAGTIIDITEHGRNLQVRVDQKHKSLATGPWTAREMEIDLSALIRPCLSKLQPGAPGWTIFQTLAGNRSSPPDIAGPLADRTSSLLEVVVREGRQSLDGSQRAVLEQCLGLPPLFGVQGPPGTGKTMVLGVLAECLARMGKRVLIVAPTHQAVNNALSGIHALFEKRPIVKVGDELRRESLSDEIECKLLRDATKNVPPKLHSEVITGMTFVSAMHHLALRSSGLAPNVVLIDEAGQLPLVQGACAGLFGAGSILLFGDDAQMPPVFASEVSEDPLAVSLFRRLREVQPQSIAMLSTTYRLNDELCRLTADTFYSDVGSKLVASPSAATRRFVLSVQPITDRLAQRVLGPEPVVVWLQTPGTTSQHSNVVEAKAIAHLIAACLMHGKQSSDVAVVTPYRRQAALIRQQIQSLLQGGADMPIVDTVERVQGLTVDIVVLSFATSDPEFAATVAGFLFSPNRLNVAISRAQTKVVVACSHRILDAAPSNPTALRGLQSLRRVLGHAVEIPIHQAGDDLLPRI